MTYTVPGIYDNKGREKTILVFLEGHGKIVSVKSVNGVDYITYSDGFTDSRSTVASYGTRVQASYDDLHPSTLGQAPMNELVSIGTPQPANTIATKQDALTSKNPTVVIGQSNLVTVAAHKANTAAGGTGTTTYRDKYQGAAQAGESALDEAARLLKAGNEAIFKRIAQKSQSPTTKLNAVVAGQANTAAQKITIPPLGIPQVQNNFWIGEAAKYGINYSPDMTQQDIISQVHLPTYNTPAADEAEWQAIRDKQDARTPQFQETTIEKIQRQIGNILPSPTPIKSTSTISTPLILGGLVLAYLVLRKK